MVRAAAGSSETCGHGGIGEFWDILESSEMNTLEATSATLFFQWRWKMRKGWGLDEVFQEVVARKEMESSPQPRPASTAPGWVPDSPSWHWSLRSRAGSGAQKSYAKGM